MPSDAQQQGSPQRGEHTLMNDMDAAFWTAVETDFSAECAALAAPGDDAVSAADLMRYLTDPSFDLTTAQQRRLAQDARLQRDLFALERDLGAATIQVAAAAAEGALAERPVEGGAMTLVPARREGQLYLKIALEAFDQQPSMLFLRAEDGRMARRSLDGRFNRGVATLILDLARDEDAALANLVRDPAAMGAIL